MEFVVDTALLTVINWIIVIPLYGTVKYIDVWIFTSFMFTAYFSRVYHYQTKHLQYESYYSNYICFSLWKWMRMNTTMISDGKLNTYVRNATVLSFYVLYCFFLLLVPYIYCCLLFEVKIFWVALLHHFVFLWHCVLVTLLFFQCLIHKTH
jgi:hypothetical protein